MGADRDGSFLDQCWRVVHCGRLLERTAGLVATVAGRNMDAPLDSFELDMYGRQLFYGLRYLEGAVAVLVGSLDTLEEQAPPVQRLLRVRADRAGYGTAVSLIRALERSQIRDPSRRPLLLGEPGHPDSWLIGP